jgi:hypothetical protein
MGIVESVMPRIFSGLFRCKPIDPYRLAHYVWYRFERFVSGYGFNLLNKGPPARSLRAAQSSEWPAPADAPADRLGGLPRDESVCR